MEEKDKKRYKIWVNTCSFEIDETIRKALIRDFGNVSTGARTVLHAYSIPESFRNILKLEETKRDLEIMKMRTEQLQQLLRENNMLTRRVNELDREVNILKEKGAKK